MTQDCHGQAAGPGAVQPNIDSKPANLESIHEIHLESLPHGTTKAAGGESPPTSAKLVTSGSVLLEMSSSTPEVTKLGAKASSSGRRVVGRAALGPWRAGPTMSHII